MLRRLAYLSFILVISASFLTAQDHLLLKEYLDSHFVIETTLVNNKSFEEVIERHYSKYSGFYMEDWDDLGSSLFLDATPPTIHIYESEDNTLLA